MGPPTSAVWAKVKKYPFWPATIVEATVVEEFASHYSDLRECGEGEVMVRANISREGEAPRIHVCLGATLL